MDPEIETPVVEMVLALRDLLLAKGVITAEELATALAAHVPVDTE